MEDPKNERKRDALSFDDYYDVDDGVNGGIDSGVYSGIDSAASGSNIETTNAKRRYSVSGIGTYPTLQQIYNSLHPGDIMGVDSFHMLAGSAPGNGSHIFLWFTDVPFHSTLIINMQSPLGGGYICATIGFSRTILVTSYPRYIVRAVVSKGTLTVVSKCEVKVGWIWSVYDGEPKPKKRAKQNNVPTDVPTDIPTTNQSTLQRTRYVASSHVGVVSVPTVPTTLTIIPTDTLTVPTTTLQPTQTVENNVWIQKIIAAMTDKFIPFVVDELKNDAGTILGAMKRLESDPEIRRDVIERIKKESNTASIRAINSLVHDPKFCGEDRGEYNRTGASNVAASYNDGTNTTTYNAESVITPTDLLCHEDFATFTQGFSSDGLP